MPKWGPPDGIAGSHDYYRHYRFCQYHGVVVDWDEFLRRVSSGSKYGPPGSAHDSPEARRHRRWCERKGPCTWEEYIQASPRCAAELDPDAIAARVARNQAKLREKGFLK